VVLGFILANTLYKRAISDKIRDLATHFPAVVLTGARQTGKTTVLTGLFPRHSYVSLDVPADAALAEEDPDAFLRKYPPPVLIDEVQYAPKLFRHLKVAIDRQRSLNGQFILTGSQKFTLMKGVADSLAGRCGLLELETLSVAELGHDLQEALKARGAAGVLCRGFYPQLWVDRGLAHVDFYRSYLATYIERDVRQILNIGSLRDFDRFMRVCAARTAQLVNRTEIAKDVGVSPKTISEWLSVLHASNQIVLLEPYFTNPGKRLVKSPKLYLSDCGLAAYLLGLTPETLAGSSHGGALWETFVLGELRKALPLRLPEASLWFYRDQQNEVDFVLAHGGALYLADAKLKENPTERDFGSLVKVGSSLKNARAPYFVLGAGAGFPAGPSREVASGFAMQTFLDGLSGA